MRAYRDFLPSAPEDLGTFVGLKTVPSTDPFPQEHWGKRACCRHLLLQRLGRGRQEGAGAAPRRAARRRIFNWMGTMPFPAMQSLFDALYPEGPAVVLEGRLREDAARRRRSTPTSQHAAKAPSELSLMHLYPIDGAVHRVGKDETAWSCRDATWSMVIAGIDPESAEGRAAEALGPRPTGRRCIPSISAAPIPIS